MTVHVTLIGKPDCHLCDDARAAVSRVVAHVGRADRSGGPIEVEVRELNILEDASLARRYSEKIPVVRVGEKQHAIWTVDETKLAAAIEKAASRRGLLRRTP
ncbi:hypothetical protein GCM10009847_09010 [Leucobacter tardus]|uniref:Glutaredoxin family protein n=1 Tax=Leucobacter tardus TaxID=501483 RepID=A0A939QBD6_9MICO|nr:glutaredoxin family protein [Leucobacter tardus]MBO2989102.1 glutaredoxin family protein [Leucobacter tardus]